jgi:hypothetical protein
MGMDDMKLYVGSRDIKPEGYLTVDIDQQNNPDIVANILDMHTVHTATCDEIVASHVLEHLEWPDSFKALAEFSRVLKLGGIVKIAIPDMRMLLNMMNSGEADFYATGLIFGVGGYNNPFEMHRYGFTEKMLKCLLSILGFSQFSWWATERPEGAAGWCYGNAGKTAISLNIEAVKNSEPVVDSLMLYEKLKEAPLTDPRQLAADVAAESENIIDTSDDLTIYQKLHFMLIDAKQRIKYLEQELENKKKT